MESDDVVEINGITFNKPFVEKPVSAEDHNIYIYYPSSAGGGSQRLFRKVSRGGDERETERRGWVSVRGKKGASGLIGRLVGSLSCK